MERKNKNITCFTCGGERDFEDFQYLELMPNHRHYNCRECEALVKFKTGVSVSQSANRFSGSNKDIYPYPNLIESNRYIMGIKKQIDGKRKRT